MAKPATSQKPDPIDTPYLFRRGRQFHYRRRVPDWLQPIAQTATWWARLGGDEAKARREAIILSRRHDRLCTSDMRRLVRSEGGADRVRDQLHFLTLEPLRGSPAELLEGLHTESPETMRTALALHAAITAMAQSDKVDRERIVPRLASLTETLSAAQDTSVQIIPTVSEVAREWLQVKVKPATRPQYTMVLRRFREAIGDPPLTSVDVPTAWLFQDQIKEMPAFAKLPGTIRRASVPVQLAWHKDHPDHPSILPGAVENHVSAMRSLFSWCMKRAKVTSNPFARMERPDDPRGDDPHHFAAMPYADLPAFMTSLGKHDHSNAKALAFLILTATRTAEVTGARWSEMALEKRLWSIPPSRMKASKTHEVPLSDQALDILNSLPREGANDLVFGSIPKNGLRDFLHERMGKPNLTVHGFRSSFRDWCAEETTHDPAAAELALAHAVGSKIETAYRRGSMFAKRRALMDDWAKWCGAA